MRKFLESRLSTELIVTYFFKNSPAKYQSATRFVEYSNDVFYVKGVPHCVVLDRDSSFKVVLAEIDIKTVKLAPHIKVLFSLSLYSQKYPTAVVPIETIEKGLKNPEIFNTLKYV